MVAEYAKKGSVMSNDIVRVNTYVHTSVEVERQDGGMNFLAFLVTLAPLALGIGALALVGAVLYFGATFAFDMIADYGMYLLAVPAAIVGLFVLPRIWKAVVGLGLLGTGAYAGAFLWTFYQAETMSFLATAGLVVGGLTGMYVSAILVSRAIPFVAGAVSSVRFGSLVPVKQYSWDMSTIKNKQEVERD